MSSVNIDQATVESSPAALQAAASTIEEPTTILFDTQAIMMMEDETCIMSTTPASTTMDVLLEETTMQVTQFDNEHQQQQQEQDQANEDVQKTAATPAAVETESAATVAATTTAAAAPNQIDVIGKALFPVSNKSSSSNHNGLKRLSLPTATSSASTLSTLVKKRSSLIPQASSSSLRKSLSPTHARTRRNSVAQDHGTLLDMSIVSQMHALKARNASLEKALALAQQSQSNELFKATTRIQTLEQQLEKLDKVQLESEGWEAEAKAIQIKLDESLKLFHSTAKSLTVEQAKRKKYKGLSSKLQAELLNRKWKEKWELCLMDCQDRDRDQRQVELEAQVSLLRMQVGIANLDLEDLEETVEQYKANIVELNASRQTLLDKIKVADETITSLRVEAASSRKDSNKEPLALKKDLASTRKELDVATERMSELEKQVEEVDELKEQVASLKSEIKGLEKGEKKAESKEVGELKKTVSKEVQRRERAEEESKSLKSTVKQLEADLAAARKAATAAAATKKAAAPLNASVESDEEHATAAVSRTNVVATKKAKTTKSVAAPSSPSDSSVADDAEDVAEPMDEQDEPAPEPVKVQKKTKAVKPSKTTTKRPATAMYADAASDDEETAAVVNVAKKRKVNGGGDAATLGVLADKTAVKTNVKDKKTSDVVASMFGSKKSSTSSGVGGLFDKLKKKGDAAETVAPVAKTKKRVLAGGGGGRKLDWMKNIETADVNGLGLPSMLSPIKPTAVGNNKLSGLSGMRGGSIFG
ncbi:hypothetical protein ACM66B_001332 [Microbotryomycetes sp. NB124-2]